MFLVAPVGKAVNVALMECLGFASGAAGELQEAFIPAFVDETLRIWCCLVKNCQQKFVQGFGKAYSFPSV